MFDSFTYFYDEKQYLILHIAKALPALNTHLSSFVFTWAMPAPSAKAKIFNNKMNQDTIPSPGIKPDYLFNKSTLEASEITSPLEDLINLQYNFNL